MESQDSIYTYEQLLEMLGGFKYFSREQVLYCFHKLNNNKEDAEMYLKHCLAESNKVNQYHNKFITQEEIDAINAEMKLIEEEKDNHIINI
jgi:hypothetical protein